MTYMSVNHDPRCAIVRTGDIRAWCDCGAEIPVLNELRANNGANDMDIQPNLCANAMRKVALLITKAADIGMDLSDYGDAGENSHNGNVYLWLSGYSFSLYIPLGGSDRIHACWHSPYTDEEEFIEAHDMTLHDLETWAEELTEAASEKEEA